MSNPVITNVGLVSRNDQLAVLSSCIVDGSGYAADAVIPRGALLVKNTSGALNKWHVFVHGTDVLAADGVRIAQDSIKVLALQDSFAAAYLEGFFKLSDILDANPGALAGDLTVAAGFHLIETDEVRLK